MVLIGIKLKLICKKINMEIGSFIELYFESSGEYHNGKNVARLNTGRAAIYHALQVLGCSEIYLPYYQCDTVRDFLLEKKIVIKYYNIDKDFTPKIDSIKDNSVILLVNYYGVMSNERMANLASKYKNVIIDNSQAFFSDPIDNCLNVYSPRKFVGTPDGAYVVGNDSTNDITKYSKDFSSDTSLFLLQRIEYGCEGKSYQSRKLNEDRLNKSGVLRMSNLTEAILKSLNYERIKNKRRENFKIASKLFDKINAINPRMYHDDKCIPMVYPLFIEDEGLLPYLHKNKIFQGRWWEYLLNEIDSNMHEYWLTKNLIPITIDQRYGRQELEHINNLINGR